MRRSEKEVTDPGEIGEIIERARVCRIGLVDGDEAYIVPMNFGHAQGCLWFHSAAEGRKVELIKRTGKATFEIDLDEGIVLDPDAYRCSNNFSCVMGEGKIRMVTSPEERAMGIEVLMRHYHPGDYHVSERCMTRTVVIKLEIERISCKRNRRD